MTIPAGWEGILDPGEEIAWQGRPDGAFLFRPPHFTVFLIGLVFAGFSLVWMIAASFAGGFFWAFGLIHFSIGIGMAIGPMIWSTIRRRNTWYTLTTRRAIIATDLPVRGRSLKSYPIDAGTKLELLPDTPATIWFAETDGIHVNNRPTIRKIGFERIPDGTAVYRMMRDIQQAAK